MKSFTNLFILFFILIVLGFLYKRFEDKRIREENQNDTRAIQDYLLDSVTLGKSKKPILWIHIPYEYNSRKWLNFGSRSSLDLNQPYLYLTVRSIISNCDKSFTICLIDDNSFAKLLPEWNIDMSKLSDPILSNIRTLGLLKLMYKYGGMLCPISFLCMKDLSGLYNKGIRNNKFFVCETIDRNITSTDFDYYPNISFCGAIKESDTIMQLCDFITRTISNDNTAQSVFLGDFNRWCNKRIETGQINMIDGVDIGIKTVHGKPILLDNLLSNNYLDLYPNVYGILIPSNEILMRRNYEWFARMSPKQVLESDTIIGNYLLLSLSPKTKRGILEPLEVKPNWVGFWRTPLQDVYGLKPNMLGDNLIKEKYPRQ
jgi:hypothetical protein